MESGNYIFPPLHIITCLTAVLVWNLTQVNPAFGAAPSTHPVHTAVLTQEEQDWLATHPTIRVAPDPDFPPVELFDEHGRYQGIAADYLALIEEQLGIKFEILHPQTWDEALALAKNRKADVLAAAMNSPQRSEYLLFTDAHIRLPGVILVRTGVEEAMTMEKLAGMKVAVVSGYVWQDLITNDHPDIDLHPVPDIRTGLRKVSFGMVDAMVGDPATSTYYIEREGITNLRIGGQSEYSYELAIASRKDWPQLNSILNKVLNNIPPEDKRAIASKWISLRDESSILAKRIWHLSLVGFSLSGMIVLGIWFWNRVLALQVSDKTKELNNELAQRVQAEQRLSELNQTLDQRVKDRTTDLYNLNKSLSHEINVRKQVEEAFRASEQRFALAVRGSSDGLWDWHDVEQDDEWWSPRFYELLGYKESEIDASLSSFRSLLHPEDLERTIEAMRLQFEDDIPFDMEYRLRCQDGCYRWFRARGILIRGNQGKPQRMAGSIQDIHDRKVAEQQIEQANDELQQKNHEMEQFVYTVSHDLKSPIVTMFGYTSYMREGIQEGNTGQALDAVDRIENAAKHMRLSIENLLHLSRVGQVIQEPASVDLNEIVRSITDEMDLMFKSAGISVVIHPDIPMVLVDSSRIREVYVNLLTNALKYGCTNPHPQIMIGGFQCDDQVRLYVRDNGVGVDPEYHEKIFQLFQRLTSDKDATGVGLALVKRITNVHGGDVWIESPIQSPELGDPGPGAAFWFTLPLAVETNQLASSA